MVDTLYQRLDYTVNNLHRLGCFLVSNSLNLSWSSGFNEAALYLASRFRKTENMLIYPSVKHVFLHLQRLNCGSWCLKHSRDPWRWFSNRYVQVSISCCIPDWLDRVHGGLWILQVRSGTTGGDRGLFAVV